MGPPDDVNRPGGSTGDGIVSFRKRLARARRQLMGRTPPPVRHDQRGEANRYFYLGPELAMVRLRSGHMLYVDPLDEHVSANIIAHGYWEDHVYGALMALVRPGFRIVEVGANVGYYTISMADAVGPEGRVTAFEGNPRLANLIRRSVQLNGFLGRVQTLAKAALDRAGQTRFVVSRSNSGGGYVSVWDGPNAYEDGQELMVETVRIDDQDLGRVDLIRIDAEGSEPFILRGAEAVLSANPDIILCLEWSVIQMGSRTSMPDFVGWLEGLGFKFWRIENDSSLRPVAVQDMITLPQADVIAARKRDLIRPAL